MRRASAAVLSLLVVASLLMAVWEPPMAPLNAAAQVDERLAESGVRHPVTAVLLNFRSYDTLLEVAVLLVAVVAGLALRQIQPDQARPRILISAQLRALLHGLIPLMVLVAGYLLWAGTHRPGGAFQAGAVLAASGVLLRLSGVRLPVSSGAPLRAGLVGGLMVFLLVAVITLATGGVLLAYPPGWAGPLVFAVEAALAVSIGLILLSLFAVAPPPPHGGAGRPRR